METKDLKYYSKTELQRMHISAIINWCPSCKKYHVEQKSRWPLYNMSLCSKCAKDIKTVKNMLT